MNVLSDTDFVAVDSTMLRAVAYDPETQCLTLKFQTGGVYEYSNVPQNVYDGLLAADSKGQYAHACIIDAYLCRQVLRR